MAKIREEFSLVDKFSAGFSKFISFAQKAAGQTRAAQSAAESYGDAISSASREVEEYGRAAASASTAVDRSAVSVRNYESVANSLEKKLIGMNSQWDALIAEQTSMAAAGQQNTAAFTRLDNKIVKLASDLNITENQFKTVSAQLQTSRAALDANQQKLNQVNGKLQTAKERLTQTKTALDQLNRETQEANGKTEQFVKKQSRLTTVLKQMGTAAGNAAKKLFGLARQSNVGNSLTKQFNRFALVLLSVTRIINALKNAMELAPEGVQQSWDSLKNSLSTVLNGTLVSVLQALQPAFDRLNAALSSPAGQQFAAGMIVVGNVLGTVIGFVLNVVASLIEFIGNNFVTIFTIAAVVAGVFAVQMLMAAAGALATAWPLLLLVGIVAAVIVGLQSLGVTSEQIFSAIGAAAGWLYALVYNLIADAWNTIAVFAEFFANVFNDPVAAVAHLFFDTFDAILGIVETVAGAIDAILHTDMAGAVSGFRGRMNAWVNDTFGENAVKIERMEKVEYGDIMAEWSAGFGEFGAGLDDFEFNIDDILGSVGNVSTPSTSVGSSVGGIGSSVGSSLGSDVSDIKKEVSMSEEDLKSLVDMAERQYVNEINLTSQTPVIQVAGQNTGNTKEDRKALANAIRDILVEQLSSSSFKSTARTV